jgi:hypothetical protein
MKTRFSHAAAFGAAGSIAVIALSLIIYLLELHEALNYLSYIVIIAVLCIGVKKWREQEGGFLSFGGAYKHLMLQSLVYSIIMSIWTVVFSVYIAPGLMEDRMLLEQAKMEDQGLPQEQIDMAMDIARWMAQPAVLVVLILVGGMLVYAMLNLIIAAIMKKDPPPPPFEPPMGDPYSNAPYGGTPNQQYENLGNQQPPSNFPPQP